MKFGSASEGYLEALGARILAGRLFEPADRRPETPGVVLSESAARFMFPTQDPVGRVIDFRLPPLVGVTTPPRVVGVVNDIKYDGLDAEANRAMYVPWEVRAVGDAYLVVRTRGDPAALGAAVRGIVRQLDPNVPVPDTQTLESAIAQSILDRRLRLVPAFGLAGLGLAVALVGVFGSLTRAVTERRHELAIRAAIGASPRQLLRSVLWSVTVVIAAGLAVGLGAAALGTRSLTSLLYGVSPADPVTLLAVSIVVVATSFCACLGPALRATRLDPTTVLRGD